MNPAPVANWLIVKDWDEKSALSALDRAPRSQALRSHRGSNQRGAAMDQGPLVTAQIDAGAELCGEFDKYEPVKIAFWLKASDEEQRYFYIASERIDDTNFDLAYGEVLRLGGQDAVSPPRPFPCEAHQRG